MLNSIYKLIAHMGIVLSIGVGLLSAAFAEQGEGRSTQFQNWTVTCSDVDGQTRCAMVQILKQEDQTQPFLRVELSKDASGGLSGAIIAPFGLDISKGVSLSIDGGERWNLPYRTCQNFGCVVRLSVGSDIVDRMKKGDRLDVSLYTLDAGSSIEVSVSLSGFSAAYGAL